jgi:hypothetical protein
MRRRAAAVASALAVVGATFTVGLPAGAATDDGGDSGLEVFVGEVDGAGLEAMRAAGLDHEDVATGNGRDGRVAVEAVMSRATADKLRGQGVGLEVKQVDGQDASQALRAQALSGYEVYRSYSEPGGIRDELVQAVRDNPDITKLVTVGQSVEKQDILAVKVTKNASRIKDGQRPSVIYVGTQHAREWITPEMVRRLMHDVLEGYRTDEEMRRLVDSTELWFLPVANPDGYDLTFEPGYRLWRKNTLDVDGDGTVAAGDGVDPNRNFPYKWGYDNEGSSPEPASETYRGDEPGSEPETKALDALAGRVGFDFMMNYHSAAELILYGVGWQVSTPSPDDHIYEALAGTDDNPAVPGYDPDLSAELYTTNGETNGHMQHAHGILGFTPEMSTCQTVSAWYDDEWEPSACASVFNFPDDEKLVQEEYEKNVPFALSLARSAARPDEPETVTGLTAPDLVVDDFTVSHGTEQPVAVEAKRSLRDLQLRWRVNDGRVQSARTAEWTGGETYGEDGTTYLAEFRGTVTGAGAGDTVEAWFTAVKPGAGPVESERFTYRVADDIGGDVLVLAAEDWSGISNLSASTGPQFADEHVAAVEAAGRSADVYDIDANDRTAPHHLGVLSHYDAVVWETGDDIVPRETGQPAGTADKLSLDVELAVRDYLNEGGKAIVSGQYNRFAEGADGVYYYNPFAPPQCTTYGTYPCLPLFNDFLQYWLGAFSYASDGGTDPDGEPYPLGGVDDTPFEGFAGELNAAESAGNQSHTASFLVTSSFLPIDDFPQFASAAVVDWVRPGGSPYDPRTDEWYVYSQQADQAYKRLSTTVDLSDATEAELRFWSSYEIETDWDYMFVEVSVVGSDVWTTLPDANGKTTQDTGESCTAGWVEELHPFLANYMDGECAPTGETGEWHAATGKSGGWQEWVVDLSDYAGGQVEVSISYASDWAVQDLGVFLDDVTVLADGVEVSATSFEDDLGDWAVAGPPPGTASNANDWVRTQSAFEEGAVVATPRTVYAGFGLEGLAPDERNAFVRRALAHLLD